MELLTDTLIANLVKKPGNSPAFFYSAKSEVFLSSRLAIGGARWLLKPLAVESSPVSPDGDISEMGSDRCHLASTSWEMA